MLLLPAAVLLAVLCVRLHSTEALRARAYGRLFLYDRLHSVEVLCVYQRVSSATD